MNLHPPHATTPWLKQGMVKFKGLRKGSVAEPIYNHSPDARAKIFQHKHKHANITLSLSSHQNLITSIIHHPTASHQPQSKNTSQNTHTQLLAHVMVCSQADTIMGISRIHRLQFCSVGRQKVEM
jgi:hypothetical protein